MKFSTPQAPILFHVLLLVNVHLVMPFTVIMPDSGALVDGPQTGLPGSNTGAQTDPEEQEAVYDIMRATGNDWATEIPNVCRGRWHGIECVPDKDNVFHVVSLSFGSLSDDTAFPTCDPTRSTISPSITKLPHLRTLFFYRCFTNKPQPIPSFLGQLGSSLQTLVLRENNHIGPIPPELGNLTYLTVLDLHKNNLNGSIPHSLGHIQDLRSLDLSCNKLSGSFPNITFPSLSILDLNQNHLKGSLPNSLLSSNSLLKIDLSRNRISGPIPNLENLENLVLLDLSYNTLTGPLPNTLQNQRSLQALILNGNPSISTTIPKDMFLGLNNLIILGLSNTDLKGPIPESLGELAMLRVLHLDGNQLNGTIPSTFAKLNSLSELRLDNNKLIGPIPFKRERVWRMGRKLRIHNNLGLCYDEKSGLGDDLDSLASAGIGLCDVPKNVPASSVQHISTLDYGNMLNSTTNSSASPHKNNAFVGVITIFFVFVSCLL
ncbi:protein TOO MANY MOUTHS-like [Salvia splendens]|uniref:protein TOO MANY MOUTHS-like n=1 Tax=Salvia splendens TaxID=180675 RepID=UPI001C257453|nr:protein TOO MANY MOUTHS-like [Salvia splendens]